MNETKENDLISVLRNLGFKAKEAKQRASSVLNHHDESTPLEDLIKAALAWVRPPSDITTTATLSPAVQENAFEPHPLAAGHVEESELGPGPELKSEEEVGGPAWLWILTPMVLMGLAIFVIGVFKSLLILGGIVLLALLVGHLADSTA
jgi:uncharacterized MAPEG superfamily protein